MDTYVIHTHTVNIGIPEIILILYIFANILCLFIILKYCIPQNNKISLAAELSPDF